MKNISLEVDEKTFQETEKILSLTNKDRNGYFNEALHFYNEVQRKEMLAGQLRKESKLVSKESMTVLAEFENLPDGN